MHLKGIMILDMYEECVNPQNMVVPGEKLCGK